MSFFLFVAIFAFLVTLIIIRFLIFDKLKPLSLQFPHNFVIFMILEPTLKLHSLFNKIKILNIRGPHKHMNLITTLDYLIVAFVYFRAMLLNLLHQWKKKLDIFL